MSNPFERSDLTARSNVVLRGSTLPGLEPDHEVDGDREGDSPSSSGHDIHHDPYLIPACPALKSLAATIHGDLEAISKRPLRQRTDATLRRLRAVENIVANLVHLRRDHAPGARLVLSPWGRRRTRYERQDCPGHLIAQAIKEMHQAGLVVWHKGKWGGITRSSQYGIAGTVAPSPRLRSMLAGVKLGAAPIGRAPGAETIILSASRGMMEPKVLINYPDTPEADSMRAEMEAINRGLNAADIRLDGLPPPMPIHLTRRFQIGHPAAPQTFGHHGRLYGGFWINLPKTERHLIRINGEPPVDLDFSGMLPRLAYLEACHVLLDDDPYAGIEGLPREAAKIGLNAMLFRSGPRDMRALPTKLRRMLGPEWKAGNFSEALAARHPTISHMFGSGIGLKLMFTESRILVRVLLDLLSQGFPGLPAHDGLMVAASGEQAARRAMAKASRAIVGAELPVRRKEIITPAT